MIAFADRPRLDAAERAFAEEHGLTEADHASIRVAFYRHTGGVSAGYPYSAALARAFAPKPIVALARAIFLRDSDRRRLFADHDPGDEDGRARNYGRMVCGRDRRAGDRRCDLEPMHLGPHDWEREIDPKTLIVLKPFNRFALVTDEELADAERAEFRFSPHDGDG